MPNKSLSIYGTSAYKADEGDQLVLEIANSYLACVATKGAKKTIVGCEVFNFNQDEVKNPATLLAKISQDSEILSQVPSSVRIYINNERCIPVPIFQFTREIAVDYLNIVFGEDYASKIRFEHLPVEPGIMNVYRVNQHLFEVLHEHFGNASIHHTYSNIIKTLVNEAELLSEALINVQFYNSFFIVVIMKGGKLYLIQTFVYETPEDVLYYLLNISQQFKLDIEVIPIQIAGMIDLDFKLYRELITYFKKVTVHSVHESKLALQTGEYPLHYFTPYFNLAL